jgi:thiamine biosynthesis protein ThiS
MADDIGIILDGFPEQVPQGLTLQDLIALKSAQHKDLVVELEGRFVYPRDYSSIYLQPGARVELLYLAFGG